MAIFLALISMSWFLGAFILNYVNLQLLGYDSETFRSLKEVPSTLALPFKITELVALLLMLLLPALLFAYLAYPSPLTYLRLDAKMRYGILLLGICILLAALPFTGMLEEWSSKLQLSGEAKELDERYTMLSKLMLSGHSISDLLLNLFIISLVPAFVEEVFFRGCMQNIILSWMRSNPWTGLVITAAIFSAFHGQLSGFFPRFFLGLLLGLVYYFTSNLWISIAMHFVNNAITVVMVFLFNNQKINTDVTSMPAPHILLGLTSLAVTAFLTFYLYKIRLTYQYIEVSKEEESKNINNE